MTTSKLAGILLAVFSTGWLLLTAGLAKAVSLGWWIWPASIGILLMLGSIVLLVAAVIEERNKGRG